MKKSGLLLGFLLIYLLVPSRASEAQINKSIIIYGIHGLGARAAWLDAVKNYLEAKDPRIKFIAHDLPGFGLNNSIVDKNSPYKKGHIESYHEWIDFVDEDFRSLKKQYPESNFIIFGHSLGGVIASNMSAVNEADALILSVPGYAGGDNFNLAFMLDTAWKYAFDKKVLKKDLYVNMPVSQKLYPSPFVDDPYRIAEVTANLLIEISKLQAASKKAVQNIKIPVLMIQVKDDKVLDTKKQEEFLGLMASSEKTFKSYLAYDHEWMGNPHAELILKDLSDYIKETF
jgi:lysophospholipase